MGVNKEGDRGGTEEMVTSEERFDSRAVLGPTFDIEQQELREFSLGGEGSPLLYHLMANHQTRNVCRVFRRDILVAGEPPCEIHRRMG